MFFIMIMFFRIIIFISWTEKVANKGVLVRANEARSILKTIWRRKHRLHDLGMFYGMTTYSMTLSKGKCWARVLGVKKEGVIA